MHDSRQPAHFLLVEDDPAHAELILMTLEECEVRCTVTHVSDGPAALGFLRKEGEHADAPTPDLILLDLKLPKLSGLDVLDRIKRDDALRAIPVVILTTSANETDRARAYGSHVNSFLTKPVDFAEFQQLARDLGMYWAFWNQKPPPSCGATAA